LQLIKLINIILLGYKCCKKCTVTFNDENGDWGIEDGEWYFFLKTFYTIVKYL